MGDPVVWLGLSDSRQVGSDGVRQRRREDFDFETRQLSGRPVSLTNTPMEVLFQVGHNVTWLQVSQIRESDNLLIKMNEPLLYQLRIVATVRALGRNAVSESRDQSNKGRRDEPFLGVFGDRAKEEDDRETAVELILLELGPGSPIPYPIVAAMTDDVDLLAMDGGGSFGFGKGCLGSVGGYWGGDSGGSPDSGGAGSKCLSPVII